LHENATQIAFFENLWPAAAAGRFTATQNIANNYVRSTAKGDFTTTLQAMDFSCTTKKGTPSRSGGKPSI
jgi:hypothetical protein